MNVLEKTVKSIVDKMFHNIDDQSDFFLLKKNLNSVWKHFYVLKRFC